MTTALAIPETSEQMEEFLADNKARSTVFSTTADPKELTAFMNAYAKLSNKASKGDLDKQIASEVEKGLAAFAKNANVTLNRYDMRPASAGDVRANRATGKTYNKAAMGVPLDGEFTDMMDFMNTIDTRVDPRGNDQIVARRAKLRNAMSSTVPADGGFLIPEEFRAELMKVALESAVVRPRARVIPMASLRAAIPTVDSTSNASTIFGGIVAYWTEEAAALVQSSPTFGRVVLEAKKLTAYTEVPNELVQDSAISVQSIIDEMFPAAIAWYEDAAFLLGTGVGEPLGVFNTKNSALVATTIEAGQPTASIVWENIVKMYARMLPSSLMNAVWIVSPDAFPELATMALSVGTGGAPVWLPNGADSPYSTLLGRPVIISEKVNRLGQQGDISFVDFGQYLIGDRMAMSAMSSTDFRFGTDTTAYRVIERVDGRPWLQSAITPKNGGNTLSPFVQLAVRP
jgi:HK97 family phage major capsid protein